MYCVRSLGQSVWSLTHKFTISQTTVAFFATPRADHAEHRTGGTVSVSGAPGASDKLLARLCGHRRHGQGRRERLGRRGGARQAAGDVGRGELPGDEGVLRALLRRALGHGAVQEQRRALAERVEALSTERRQLEKELADVRKKLAAAGSGGGGQIGPEDIGGTPVIARIVEDVPAKDLKGLADEFMGQIGSGVVALIGTEGGKASIVAAVGPDHTDSHNAVELVRAASAAVGGKGGGGRPDMAQAGGPDVGQADAGLEAMRTLVRDAG